MFDDDEEADLVFKRRRDKDAKMDLGDDDDMNDSPFGRPPGPPFGGGGPGGNPFGGGGPGGPFGRPGGPSFGAPGGPGGSPFGPPGGMGQEDDQPSKSKKSYSDQAIDLVLESSVKGAKGSATGLMTYGRSFSSMTVVEWAVAGNTMLRSGFTLALVTFVLSLVSKLLGYGSLFWITAGFFLSGIVGLFIWGFTYDRAKELAGEPSEALEFHTQGTADDFDDFDDDSFGDDSFGDDSDPFDEDPFGGQEDDDDFGEEDDDFNFSEAGGTADDDDDWDFGDDDEDLAEVAPIVTEPQDVEPKEIPAGTHTRSYLYEYFLSVLPNHTPDYLDWVDLMENGSNLPQRFEGFLLNAAQAASSSGEIDEDDAPIIEVLKENKLMYQLEFQKKGKYNLQVLVKEFANLYALKEVPVKGRKNPAVFATYETAGTSVTVTLFKGADSVMVTAKDVWVHEKDWLLDTDNIMPVVLAIDEFGEAIKQDFFEVYSAVIAGKPRSGKSWQITDIIHHIGMFVSPSEVHIYAGDMKAKLSDYYSMGIPHIKDFAGTREEILAMMEWFRDYENPRRKQFLEERGYISYNDFIQEDRENMKELPLLIFILDEITTVVKGASKEEKQEFFGLLDTFITQFPNSGMIFYGVPHRIIGTLTRDTYNNIQYKQIVKGEFNDIKDVMNVTQKDFPYTLTNTGDSVIKFSGINNDHATFAKGLAITTSNKDNQKVAKAIRRVWSKLEHESYHSYWMDEYNKRIGEFDNYSCGCEKPKSFRDYVPTTQGTAIDSILSDTAGEVDIKPAQRKVEDDVFTQAKEQPYAVEVEDDVGDSLKLDIDSLFNK